VQDFYDKKRFGYQITLVAGIDELRVMRDRAKVRMDVALEMERETLQRFAGDSTGFAAWKQATEAAAEAPCLFQSAESDYLEALAAGGVSS